jgi:VIT1/CCC1 family predicted Fe2+/Mn2+ transporter
MAGKPNKAEKHRHDRTQRLSEILFGLIMVLTFTCSLSAAKVGRADVESMLIAALGCNLAWGIIDAVFYLMGCFSERGHNLLTFQAVRRATDPSEGRRIISDAIPPVLALVVPESEFETMRQRLLELPEPTSRPRLKRIDWLAAVGVFLLVFLSTFPVVAPFIFFHNATRALRVSNEVAIVMLFAGGYTFADYSGLHRWKTGVAMVVLGHAMVAVSIAFGG